MPETTKNPITLIGARAGYCWGADVSDAGKNYKRGLDCIASDHGRTMDFPNIEAVFEGYSARVIREFYTHIGCLPTRLQASTRYIDYTNFDYVIPHTIKNNPEALRLYTDLMSDISRTNADLLSLGIPKEDVALELPLGMTTTIVDKRDLRNVIDMSRNRMCARANWEFREMFVNDYLGALKEYSKEWNYLIRLCMKPKCEVLGYCPERKGCGRYPKKENDMIVKSN